jgi:hypothetical protein
MLQFYFLSIALNLAGGLTLCSDWLERRLGSMAPLFTVLSGRVAKIAQGLGTLLVGLATLVVPAAGSAPTGDLFPSVVGMAVGVTLLFEALKQAAQFPAEKAETGEHPERAPAGFRTVIGVLGLAAAALHFFLPERLFL